MASQSWRRAESGRRSGQEKARRAWEENYPRPGSTGASSLISPGHGVVEAAGLCSVSACLQRTGLETYMSASAPAACGTRPTPDVCRFETNLVLLFRPAEIGCRKSLGIRSGRSCLLPKTP